VVKNKAAALALLPVALACLTLLVGCPDVDLRKLIDDLATKDPEFEWVRTSSFTADIPATLDDFGFAVSVYGDWAAVGDYTENGFLGAVYLLKKDTATGAWSKATRLDGVGGVNFFGKAVAISNDFLFIGAPIENPSDRSSPDDTGCVHIYQRSGDTWTFKKKLPGPDGLGAQFGYALALSDTYAVIGAPYHPGSGSSQGMAYAFYRHGGGTDNWGDDSYANLWPTLSDRNDFDFFGSTVAISGDWAVVGAAYDSGSKGAAYVFFRSATSQWGAGGTGEENEKLTASDGAAGHSFGSSVAIWSDTLVVGAPGNESAYVFSRSGSTWKQGPVRISDASGKSGDKFGSAVAVSGVIVDSITETYILVGAEGNDEQGTDAGKGFLFEVDPAGWVVRSPLLSDMPVSKARFGSAVSLWEQTAIVGAYGFTDVAGSCSLFKRQQKP
jgi:hypothetical protein